MSEPRSPAPALLVVAAFSRHEEALAWARARLQECFGPLALTSTPFLFNQTTYYQATMGADLHKQLLAFDRLVDQGCLPEVKLRSNALEQELTATAAYPEARPLNLDPGLLVLGKLLLATTKDQAHRIYLRDGIFAEVTLRYQDGAFEPWPWTYADYRLGCVHDFLHHARAFYRRRLQETDAARASRED